MAKNNLLKIVILTNILTFMVLGSVPVYAQSSGDGNASPQSEVSTQSDFQNAAYQQSGSSAASTASGSSEILKQVNDQVITVTGAPAYQPVPVATPAKTGLALWALLIASGIGTVALYFYQKRANRSHTPEEANELSAIFDEPIINNTKPLSSPKNSKKAKAKTVKKKKTHR